MVSMLDKLTLSLGSYISIVDHLIFQSWAQTQAKRLIESHLRWIDLSSSLIYELTSQALISLRVELSSRPSLTERVELAQPIDSLNVIY